MVGRQLTTIKSHGGCIRSRGGTPLTAKQAEPALAHTVFGEVRFLPALKHTPTDMTKYEKAVAYINDVACGMTQAEIAGINDDMVYISTLTTPAEDIRFRIHEDEVDALAQNWDHWYANL